MLYNENKVLTGSIYLFYPSLLFKVPATQFHVNTRLKATQQLLFLFFWVDFDGFFMLLLIPKLKNQSKSSISK